MDVGKDQVGIVFESIKHAVTVVYVDVEVTDPADAIYAAQGFNNDPKVIEHAEAGGVCAPRMMESADWLEAAQAVTVHNLRQAIQSGADDMCRGSVNTGKYRGISVIQQV